MRALASVLFVVIAFHGAVHAQPGPDARPAQPPQPPQPAQPAPYPYPPSQPYPGQPYPGQPYPDQPYPGQPYPPPAGVVPPYQYAPVRQLRMRLGMPPTTFARRLQPYLAPPLARDAGATAGVTLRF